MGSRYKIDINALNEYIKYLSSFERETDKELSAFTKKLASAHSDWNDINYDRTASAAAEISDAIKKLSAALDEAIKSVKVMTDKYSAYLNRRR